MMDRHTDFIALRIQATGTVCIVANLHVGTTLHILQSRRKPIVELFVEITVRFKSTFGHGI